MKRLEEIFEKIYELSHKDHLMEMSNLQKRRTKLPVNIWIDDSSSYKRGKHSKRIKFQITKADKIQKYELASMDLNGVVHNYDKRKSEINEVEIQQVRNFVLNNVVILSAIADQDIDFVDFVEYMIPGGDYLGDEVRSAQEELVKQHLKKFE